MSYTGAVPAAPRTADWRDTAACREEDGELFFPKGTEGPWLLVIEQAKAVCGRCPSAAPCLAFALDERIPTGIFGGLTDTERASLTRATRRNNLTQEAAADRIEEARRPRRERTMQTVFDDNTTAYFGGHLAWTGKATVHYGGKVYTPKRLSFILDRDRRPEGPVLVDCGLKDCVLAAHLTDQNERGYCGTRSGYQRHRANGEEACGPCRQANTDADNRLRRTGTTKELAS